MTDLTLIGPRFTETTKTTEDMSGQGKLSAKGPPFIKKNFFNITYRTGRDWRASPFRFFSALCDFLRKFFNVPKGPPFEFFYI